MSGPFGDDAGLYLSLGWNPVPVEPRSKRIAVDGYTGHDGEYATTARVRHWEREYSRHNIGLRLTHNVIGIDVDAYGERGGAESLASLEAELGELPQTYVSTSRTDGVSGIRLFKVSRDGNWRGKASTGIDVISWHYRYVVCAPSVHPDTRESYFWYDQADDDWSGVPSCDDLPELPSIWQEFLSSDFTGVKSERLDTDVITDWLSMVGGGEACEVMKGTCGHWIGEVSDASDSGGIHDAAMAGIHALLGDAVAGHTGGMDELVRLQQAFLNAREVRHDSRSNDAVAEWNRFIYGGVRLKRGTETLCDDPCTDEYASAEALKSMRPIRADGSLYDRHSKEIMRRTTDAYIQMRANQEAKRRLTTENAVRPPGIMTGDEWMNRDVAPPLALVPGLIALEGNTLLVAQQKAGKTTLVHNLLRAVADGDEFLDVFPVEEIPYGKRVVLLDFEMHEGQLTMWLDEQGIKAFERTAISSLDGLASSFNIMDPHCLAEWIEDLKSVNAGYIILDCCAPAWASNGIEENSATEQGAWLDAFNTMVHQCGAFGSLLVHHTGKTGESSRGSSRIEGWASDLLRLTLQGAGEDDDGKFVQSDRFLSARGRIVTDFSEVMIEKYDSRRLRVSGGTKTEVAAERVQPAVIEYIKTNRGTSKAAVEKGIKGNSNVIRFVIAELLSDGSVCNHGTTARPSLWYGCPDPSKCGEAKITMK